MLKFLRKYQMIIMIIGGSLLMVVFLLEPIITRLAPTGANTKVATIGPNNTKVTYLERESAAAEVNALRNIVPGLLTPYFIAIDAQEPGDHWLLLTREAEENGLVGEAGDGRNWIPELSQVLADTEVRVGIMQQYSSMLEMMPGIVNLMMSQPQTQQQIAARVEQIQQDIPPLVNRVTAANPFFKTTDDTYKVLAKARGVLRLLALHRTAARRSIPESNVVINRALDGVAVDMLYITPELLTESIPDPTEEELQAHFDRFKDSLPADSDFGLGYILPPRVKLEYLVLDAQRIADAITVDRVEVVKRYKRAPETYGDSLESPSRTDPSISVAMLIGRQIRQELTQNVMVDADRTLRGLMVNATRGIPTNEDGTLNPPAGWRAPTLESLAQELAETVKLPSGSPMPLPAVVRHASNWLTSDDIAALDGFGATAFRVGTTGVQVAAIPFILESFNDAGEVDDKLPIQIGVPFIDTAATNTQGDHYYVTVLDARTESPAESIDEVGRDKVLADYKQVQAYDRLVAAQDGYLDVARNSGLEGLGAQFSETTPPAVTINVVIRESAETTQGFPQQAAGANTEALRQAVLTAARERLTPLEAPADVSPLDAYLAVPAQKTRSLAVFKLLARRPLTHEQVLRQGNNILQRQTNTEFASIEDFQAKYPFTLEALARRHNYILVNKKNSKAEEPAEPEAEPATASANG